MEWDYQLSFTEITSDTFSIRHLPKYEWPAAFETSTFGTRLLAKYSRAIKQ